MGNRANFVVVENSDWRLYYAHCSGYRMLDALVGGPDFAARYARAMEPRSETQWHRFTVACDALAADEATSA